MRKYRSSEFVTKTILAFIFSLSFGYVGADHVSGGSIHWKTVANGDSLIVDIITYADCNGTVYNDGYLNLKSSKKTSSFTNLAVKSTRFISNICSTYCTPCSSGSCSNKVGFQEIIYTKKVLLSKYIDSKNCRIDFNYSDCCRPRTFTTADSRNSNLALFAWANFCESPKDNSPLLNDSLVQAISIARKMGIDMSMTDADCDSLRYSIDSVSNVKWKKGFNSEKPLTGTFKLNKQAGIVNIITLRTEISAFSIKVASFKNGKIVSETRREYPYFIINAKSTPDYIQDTLLNNGSYRHLIALEGDTFRMKWRANKEISISSGIDSSYYKSDSAHNINMKFLPTRKDLGQKKIIFKTNNQTCPYYILNSELVNLWVVSKKDTTFKIIQQSAREECGTYKFSVPIKFYAYGNDIDWYINDKFSHSGRTYDANLNKTDTTKIKIVFTIGSHQFTDSMQFIPKNSPNALLTLNDIKLDSICADSLTLKINSSGGHGSNRYYWNIVNVSYKFNQDIKVDFSSTTNKSTFIMYYQVIDIENCGIYKTDTFTVLPINKVNFQNDSTLCDSGNYNFRLKKPEPGGIWSGAFVSDSNFFEGNLLGFRQKTTLYYKNNNPKYCTADQAEFRLRKSARLKLFVDSTACIGNDPIEIKSNLSGGKFLTRNIDTTGPIPLFRRTYTPGINKIIYTYTNNFGCSSFDTAYINVLKDSIKSPVIDTVWCYNDYKVLKLETFNTYGAWTGDEIVHDVAKNTFQLHFPFDTLIKTLEANYIEERINGCKLTKNYSLVIGHERKINFDTTVQLCTKQELELKALPKGGVWEGDFIKQKNNSFYLDTDLAIKGDTVLSMVYKLTDLYGCISDSIKKIEVWPLADLVLPYTTVDVCDKRDSFIFPEPIKPLKNYTWSGLDVKNTDSYFVLRNLAGLTDSTYKFTISATDEKRCLAEKSLLLTPYKSVTAVFNQDTLKGKAPLNVRFWATETKNITNYHWTGFESNSDTFKSRFTNHTFFKEGSYNIGLTVYGKNNICSDSTFVKKLIHVLPNSIAETQTTDVQLFPNPTRDRLYISSKHQLQLVEIYNVDGQCIVKKTPRGLKSEIITSHLSKGVYYIKTTHKENGEIRHQNFKFSKI